MIPFDFVRVGPFDVRFIKLLDGKRDKCLGLFHCENWTISLREEYPSPQIEAETVIHEILHAIREAADTSEDDGEERIVQRMSLVLAQVIRDNPDLIDWLKEKLS